MLQLASTRVKIPMSGEIADPGGKFCMSSLLCLYKEILQLVRTGGQNTYVWRNC